MSQRQTPQSWCNGEDKRSSAQLNKVAGRSALNASTLITEEGYKQQEIDRQNGASKIPDTFLGPFVFARLFQPEAMISEYGVWYSFYVRSKRGHKHNNNPPTCGCGGTIET